MRLLLIDSDRTAMSAAAAYAPQRSPLPGNDQADAQDHERQRQYREAVDQVNHIGLGRRQDPDDLRDGFF